MAVGLWGAEPHCSSAGRRAQRSAGGRPAGGSPAHAARAHMAARGEGHAAVHVDSFRACRMHAWLMACADSGTRRRKRESVQLSSAAPNSHHHSCAAHRCAMGPSAHRPRGARQACAPRHTGTPHRMGAAQLPLAACATQTQSNVSSRLHQQRCVRSASADSSTTSADRILRLQSGAICT